MNAKKLKVLSRRHWLWCVLTAWCVAWPVAAQEVSITAVFKPDSAYPQFNKFKNTTPPSGYCVNYPGQCTDNEIFSLQVPIQFDSNAPIPANHPSPRQGASLKVPAQWRDLTVYHATNGEPEKVRVRIVGVGSRYRTEDVMELIGANHGDYRLAHYTLWAGSWVNTPPPCLYSGVGYYGHDYYGFFWKTPVEAACARQAQFDIPWLRYEFLDFAYELETPKPLDSPRGITPAR